MLAKIQVFWYLMSYHLVTIYQSTEDINYDKNLVEIVKVSYFSPYVSLFWCMHMCVCVCVCVCDPRARLRVCGGGAEE
jgi:hypothetical protein